MTKNNADKNVVKTETIKRCTSTAVNPLRSSVAVRRRTRGIEKQCRNENKSPFNYPDFAGDTLSVAGSVPEISTTATNKASSKLNNDSIGTLTKRQNISPQTDIEIGVADFSAAVGNQNYGALNSQQLYEEACQYCFRDQYGTSLQANGEIVVKASLRMSEAVKGGDACLSELSQSIIKECRKLVKEASVALQVSSTPLKTISTTAENFTCTGFEYIQSVNVKLILHSLCLSIHGLRALSPVFADNIDMKDAAILLLHHIVMTSEAACQKCKEEVIKKGVGDYAETKHMVIIKELQRTLSRLAAMCLTAMETLTFLLNGYFAPSLSTNESILLDYVPFGSACDTTAHCAIFRAVPNSADTVQIKKIGKHAFDQIAVINLASLGAVTSVMSVILEGKHCTSSWMNEFGKNYSIFGPQFHFVCDDSNDELSYCARTLEGLSERHVLPWMQAMRFCSPSCNPDQHVLRQSNKIFKTLWKTSKYERYEPDRRLSLQRTALTVLLLKDCIYPHDLAKLHFEKACTLAWKAVETFLAGTPYGACKEIERFHAVVGNLLDAVAKYKVNENKGFELPSYIEYCSYRVRHVGLKLHNMNSTSCSCVFKSWCLQYNHCCRGSGLCEPTQVTLLLHFAVETAKLRVLQDNIALHHDIVDFTKLTRQIIELFQTSVLLDDNIDASWHWKLISHFNLHHFHHDLLPSWKASSIEELLLLSEIQLKCINPFSFKTVQTDVTKDKQQYQFFECMMKSSIVAMKVCLLDSDFHSTSVEEFYVEDLVNYVISYLRAAGTKTETCVTLLDKVSAVSYVFTF
jgi:hypothetical protein